MTDRPKVISEDIAKRIGLDKLTEAYHDQFRFCGLSSILITYDAAVKKSESPYLREDPGLSKKLDSYLRKWCGLNQDCGFY